MNTSHAINVVVTTTVTHFVTGLYLWMSMSTLSYGTLRRESRLDLMPGHDDMHSCDNCHMHRHASRCRQRGCT